MSEIKKIGLLTSGGDAPGMNACIRAVTRCGIYNGMEVVGIRHGYEGLINANFKEMKSHSVSNIIQRGGTILKSARSEAFRTPEGRQQAYQNFRAEGMQALVAIGGDGTFTGADIFSKEFNVPVIGIPGTIDNDLFGTDSTIGYDTALNTVVEAVDKIRDTASSHSRLFLIEVMGRDAGFIALRSAIATGAEAVVIPEVKTHVDDLIQLLESGWSRKKASSIIIVAEGYKEGGAVQLAKEIKEKFNEYDIRYTILGHIQRGGSPTCFDRVQASRMGVGAVEGLLKGHKNEMVGIVNGDIKYIPLSDAIKHNRTIRQDLLRITQILSI